MLYQTFPNKLAQKTPLTDTFDFNKVQFESKEEFKDLLLIANRILVTLNFGDIGHWLFSSSLSTRILL